MTEKGTIFETPKSLPHPLSGSQEALLILSLPYSIFQGDGGMYSHEPPYFYLLSFFINPATGTEVPVGTKKQPFLPMRIGTWVGRHAVGMQSFRLVIEPLCGACIPFKFCDLPLQILRRGWW